MIVAGLKPSTATRSLARSRNKQSDLERVGTARMRWAHAGTEKQGRAVNRRAILTAHCLNMRHVYRHACWERNQSFGGLCTTQDDPDARQGESHAFRKIF